ncbi:MAG: A/G-specific adenine glycosylase [Magnetococcales bacterium]|nr:A/G-specific adenine glycosylase [Magnetococcales bacterium]NGZ04867.1 A/G-specific adenine glycosylase [Magnetococcales bacterium]
MEALNDPAIRTLLAQRLLAHYQHHGRDLPWRHTHDPYRIWLAEIMLQQTGVKSVAPYYQRFLNRFPTLADLAKAPLEAVLSLWQGLGYYRRARHLHAAAQQMMHDHQGTLPDQYDRLLRLPGIGPSTAGAILAIAFGQDHAILDGNVQRVLARLLALEMPPDSTSGKKRLWEVARLLTPTGQAGFYAQAIMDLGAAVCRPRQPDCPVCPWSFWCQANAFGRPEAYPVTKSRVAKPHKYQFNALIIRPDGTLLLLPNDHSELLSGLWHPPGSEFVLSPTPPDPEVVRQWVMQELDLNVALPVMLAPVHHIFTHFRLTVHPMLCLWQSGEMAATTPHRWIDPINDQTTPIATLHRKVLQIISNRQKAPS